MRSLSLEFYMLSRFETFAPPKQGIAGGVSMSVIFSETRARDPLQAIVIPGEELARRAIRAWISGCASCCSSPSWRYMARFAAMTL